MTDTSTPEDRVMFIRLIEGGGGPIAAYAARLVNCSLPIDDTHAFALHLPTSGPNFPKRTYAEAAGAVLGRVAAGRPPF